MTSELPVSAGTVLIVEDEPLLCAYLSEILGRAGFSARCVHSDLDAYSALREPGNLVGLFADINLGRGTTGFDVARFARTLHPDLHVVYISGQSSQAHFATFGVQGSQLIGKPFTEDQITACLVGMRSHGVCTDVNGDRQGSRGAIRT